MLKVVNDNCPKRIALSDLPEGASGRVAELSGHSEYSQRLREIGFCESAIVQKIAGQHMMICQLCGTRVALSDAAAKNILVDLINGGPDAVPPLF